MVFFATANATSLCPDKMPLLHGCIDVHIMFLPAFIGFTASAAPGISAGWAHMRESLKVYLST